MKSEWTKMKLSDIADFNPRETIKKGEKFTKENIWVKRPGTGSIKAEYFNQLLGKIANRDIDYDEHIDWSDINE